MTKPVSTPKQNLQRTFGRLEVVESVSTARVLAGEDANCLTLVFREKARLAVFQCPCGCKDLLTINLDRNAGVAWRHKLRQGRLTLLPSVWRTSGCESHFILWENHVWWCFPWWDESSETTELPNEADRELTKEWRRIRAERKKSQSKING